MKKIFFLPRLAEFWSAAVRPRLIWGGLAVALTSMSHAGDPGKLTVEIWWGIPGYSVTALTSHARFPASPDLTGTVSGIEPGRDVGADFGRRLRGWITAPVTGDYTFWIAGDNNCELYLSTDGSVEHRHKIAEVTGSLSWTAFRQFDLYPSQKSVALPLVQGGKYYVEILHKEAGGGDHLSVAWQYPGVARQVVPATVLEAFQAEPNDVDHDGLPDDWEQIYGLSTDPTTGGLGANGPYGDPDGDGFTNRQEWLAQTSPVVWGNLPGGLKREVWYDLPGDTIAALTGTQSFYGAAHRDEFMSGAAAPSNGADSYGQRLRGYVTIPATGIYRFYVAGDNEIELWLGSDGSPFSKQLAAFIHGSWTPPEVWTQFLTQKSTELFLQQGQVIYVEILHKEGALGDNAALGWSVNGGTPIKIPAANLQAYALHPNDWDDDGLPDDWELAHGFDLEDNGLLHPEQRAQADPDGDGATNQLEAVMGENPWAAEGIRGYWERSVWKGIEGRELAAIKNSPRLYTAPDQRDLVNRLDGATTVGGENCAYRFRGWVTPSESGLYQFRAAGDDAFEVWVSSDASKFHRRLVASSQFVTPRNNYTAYDTQYGHLGLEAGRPCYVEILLKQGLGDSHVSLQWKSPSGVFTDLPSSAMRSYVPNAEDPDDDDLSTDWELAHGFDPALRETGAHSPLADPDGDRVPNREECLGGGNPLIPDSSRGLWITERWDNMPYYSLLETVQATPFFGPPSSRELLQETGGKVFVGNYLATRTRGRVIAPVTGNYRFWVSGGTSFELWLSTDDQPFAKRRIARLGPEVGVAGGVSNAVSAQYDLFTSQQSVDIPLQAGQAYYLELLQQTGHQAQPLIAVAWAHDGGERTTIPFECMASYVPGTDDQDDDSLPDAWETAMGLDPTDNGLTDRSRQGERGDYDGDGLTNREEYLAGTNPCDQDSDHDGISDADELKSLGTDPLAHNAAGEETVQAVNIHTPAGGSMGWSDFADGVVGSRFRGSIEFDLTVPESGLPWVVAIRGKVLGQISQTDTMPLRVSLDGIELGKLDFLSPLNEVSTLRVLTPRLTAGTHRLKIFVDNLVARKTFLLQSVELRRPTGADLNADGVPDWLASFLQANSWSAAATVTTAVSPFFLEGGSRYPGSLALTAEGNALPAVTGTTCKTWFANVPLQAAMDTVVTGSFEGGDDVHTTQISWRPFLVGQTSQLDVRVGDTLKFHFPQAIADQAQVNYTLSPAAWNAQAAAAASQTYTFATAGTFTLRAVHADGAVGETTVVVHGASADGELLLGTQRARLFDFVGIPFGLKLDVAEPLRFSQAALLPDSGGTRLRLESAEEGDYGLLARLPAGGPVVTKVPVHVSAFAGATSGQYQLVGRSTLDGYITVSVPLVFTALPEGYTVRVTIVRAGVMFEDGTTTLDLTSADFIDGQYMVRFLYPENLQGGYCHSVEIFNSQGELVAKY